MAQNDSKILQYGGSSIPTENGFGLRRQQAFKRYQIQHVKLSVSDVFIQKPTGINNVTAATNGAVSVCHFLMSCFLRHLYTVSPKNRARILWPITFTNIDQYQCHLIELFLQHYLIIYHKNYSHSRVPAATVTMATSALVQTNVASAHRVRATVEYLHQVTPDFISLDLWPHDNPDLNPADYKIWGCLQYPCLSEAHTRHQRADTAPG